MEVIIDLLLPPLGLDFPTVWSHWSVIILRSERELCSVLRVLVQSLPHPGGRAAQSLLSCRPLNSTLADLIKPIAQSEATLLNQTLPLHPRALQVVSSYHLKAIFSENQ